MLVSEVTTQDVLRALHPHWGERTDTAQRVRGRIEQVLDWSVVAGHRPAGDNPAHWRGNLQHLLAAPRKVAAAGNQPAIALDDLPRWWADLARREGTGADALQFLALTAARSGEVRGMNWDEVDLAAGIWIVPAGRTKTGKEHRVPLPAAAVALLSDLPRMQGTDLVFPASRGGVLKDEVMSGLMKRIHAEAVGRGDPGYLDPASKRPAVPHGLRSSFRDWVAERTTFPGDLAELALGHRIGSAVEAAYRRGDQIEKRRKMMEDWRAALVGEMTGQVIPLRGAGA